MTSNDVTPHRQTAHDHTWQTLIEFSLSREPGSERLAVDRVAEAVQRLNWSAAPLGRLKLALARTTLNTMECSHLCGSEAPLLIRVLIQDNSWAAQEADQANDKPTQHQMVERGAQQARQLPSRGWGFFLIERAVQDSGRDVRYLIELFLYPGGK